jgi:hypothetical protein
VAPPFLRKKPQREKEFLTAKMQKSKEEGKQK